MPGTQQYLHYPSVPTYVQGVCRACHTLVTLDGTVAYNDNGNVTCGACATVSRRRDLIREALASIDPVTWSLFGSDMYVGDQREMNPGESVVYDLSTVQVAKWQHHEVYTEGGTDSRYIANVGFIDSTAYFTLRDTRTQSSSETPPRIVASWYRFGLSEIGSVPAWRQSLYGAATLVKEFPSAAIVLVAAGFESFFLETMRISWRENELAHGAFNRMIRNTPISALVEWLGPAARRPSLVDAPNSLHQRWRELVNQRRNNVVHRADVNLSSDEVMESMKVALECICFIDQEALVKPHAYYRQLDDEAQEGSSSN